MKPTAIVYISNTWHTRQYALLLGEKLANDIGKNYSVKVVTNDSLIRLSAMRSGVLRMSVKEFSDELDGVMKRIMEYIDGKR